MNKSSLFIFFVCIFILFSPFVVARPEYTTQTNQSCSTCHVNTSTGELNDMGKAFFITHKWPPTQLKTSDKILISMAGFVHLLASMILVGIIVLVHVVHTVRVLAETGVPKRLLKIGWISMFSIVVSGMYLTITTFHDIDTLLNSYSGKLVVGKMVILFIMVTFAATVTFVLNKRLKSTPHQHPLAKEMDREMTLKELKKYDGSSSEIFLAYSGVIFDVSNSKLWKNGKHGKHRAGNDLTLALREAPHSIEVLDFFKAIARLQQETWHGPTLAANVFKAMAWIILFLILLVILLSTLIAWPL